MREKKFKILFVCTGNTCRSPMAQGILEKMLREKEIAFIEVKSAGMGTGEGSPASLYAMAVASARDIDLSLHRSEKLSKKILKQADLILALSDEHLQAIVEIDAEATNKAFLLKSFPVKREGDNLSIADPIGKDIDFYNLCFIEIEKEIERILPKLIELAKREISSKAHLA